MKLRKTKPKATPEQLKLADECENKAKDNRRRERESFQRSDTDGFLSQWALTIGAEKLNKQAQVLRNGGYWQFPVLIDENKKPIAWKVYRFAGHYGRMNRRWKLDDNLTEKYGRRWIPALPVKTSRIQQKLGFSEVYYWIPAKADIIGFGTGLSGCASARVCIVQLEDDELMEFLRKKKIKPLELSHHM